MDRLPRPQEIYRHFKGNVYQIITLAEDSENGETMVVYQALYGDFKVYVRPLAMFMSPVDRQKYPECAQKDRFERVQSGILYDEVSDTAEPPSEAEEISNVTTGEGIQKSLDTAGKETEIDAESEPALDPLVWEFLDADSHEKRLNILAALHHRITDDMITTMAIACDIEVPDGDLEERYSQLKNCLIMRDRFEIRRG